MAVRKSSGAGNGANIRLAADIGGTFTDIAVFDDKTGRLTFGKALSTPDRLVDGISSGVEKAGSEYRSAGLFLHGSTVAINTILERTGAKTALITTEGFRDVYEIGRINRPDAYNLYFQKHVPLIERALRFEVKERVRADGEVVTLLDGGGQCLYRPQGSPVRRRNRRPHPQGRFPRLVPDRAIDRRPLRKRAGADAMRAHAGIGAGGRRDRHPGAVPHARH